MVDIKEYKLDITGKGCPFCLLIVQKKLKNMKSGDVVHVLCDHPPAAMENIPIAMERAGHSFKRELEEPGLWKLTIKKK
ncbi:MAG: sulfurtransferase TusA family protein [Candidatus Lokiarchaeota archaeon]|nr:sulfurtransferase TusA family protein [Candidatus Lokiarchaeota archaeon]